MILRKLDGKPLTWRQTWLGPRPRKPEREKGEKFNYLGPLGGFIIPAMFVMGGVTVWALKTTYTQKAWLQQSDNYQSYGEIDKKEEIDLRPFSNEAATENKTNQMTKKRWPDELTEEEFKELLLKNRLGGVKVQKNEKTGFYIIQGWQDNKWAFTMKVLIADYENRLGNFLRNQKNIRVAYLQTMRQNSSDNDFQNKIFIYLFVGLNTLLIVRLLNRTWIR